MLLLGDSGVGKSALAMVLAGEEFRATESTHGRRIWRLPATEDPDTSGGDREVLVWDLAGQPGYRIVHQLHLGGAAVALILFDSRSETTPLAGVYHWARAIRHAHPVTTGGLNTFLVAARTDRGGITVSSERIQQVMTDFALDELLRDQREGGNEYRSAAFPDPGGDRLGADSQDRLDRPVRRGQAVRRGSEVVRQPAHAAR